MADPKYVFSRGERGVFAEIYFPKKAEFQGTIFRALQDGYKEATVKTSLERNLSALVADFADYPADLFDPYRYGIIQKPKRPESPAAKARKRIAMYVSPFKGWSMYEVDGVFFNRRGRPYEERTQVVRLMFRFQSPHLRLARKRNCEDVLRAILYFIIGTRGHISEEMVWSEGCKQRFLRMHEWPDSVKKGFAERNFARIAKSTLKWIDDCALFTFGYLVKEFSQQVLQTGRLEEEIWVTSFFDLTLNVIQKSKRRRVVS
jgi:hypothetical protein